MVTSGTDDNVVGRGRLILGGLLLIYHPAVAALRITTDIMALPVRGTPLAFGMVARLLTAAVGFSAGMALIKRNPGADGLAQIALVVSAIFDLIVYSTSIFPNNRAPGDTPLYAATSLVYHVGWIIFLRRSKPRGSL